MEKIRVSQHSGRTGSASHNDRSFLKNMTKEDKIEKAAHINEALITENETWAWDGNTENFKQSEFEYYKQAFQAGIDRTNENYIKSRHPERCKKVEDYYNSDKTCPEEMILQIGDKDTEVSKEVFQACMSDYWTWFNQWNMEHGYPCQILNTALHTDETSIHEHIRRVWIYTDDNGYLRLGQNKALKAAGVELPEPEKKESRYNNRKMTFDKMAREKWQEICKAHGFDIETEPRLNAKHKDKAEYIADQMAAEQKKQELALEMTKQDLAQTENRLAEASESYFKAQKDLTGAEVQLNHLNLQIKPLEMQIEILKNTQDHLKRTQDLLQSQNKTLEDKNSHLKANIEQLDKEFNQTQIELVKTKENLEVLNKELADKADGQQLIRMVDNVAQLIKNRTPYQVEIYAEHEQKRHKPATVEITRSTYDSYMQDKNLIQILTELLNKLFELFRSIKESLKKEVVREQAYQSIQEDLDRFKKCNEELEDKNYALYQENEELRADLEISQDEYNEVQEHMDLLRDRFPNDIRQFERILKYEKIYDNREDLGNDIFGAVYLPNVDGDAEIRIWDFMKEYAEECKKVNTKPRKDIDNHYYNHKHEHLMDAINHDDRDQFRGISR